MPTNGGLACVLAGLPAAEFATRRRAGLDRVFADVLAHDEAALAGIRALYTDPVQINGTTMTATDLLARVRGMQRAFTGCGTSGSTRRAGSSSPSGCAARTAARWPRRSASWPRPGARSRSG